MLPSTPASVSIARKQLTADLSAAGVYEEAAGDAALVISELLSNSIKHAWPLPGEQVRAAWMVDDGSVEVEVSDGGGPTRPRQDFPPVSALGGRGLGIVERLSDDWGIRADETGQTVWAVLPAAAHPNGVHPDAVHPAGVQSGAVHPAPACDAANSRAVPR